MNVRPLPASMNDTVSGEAVPSPLRVGAVAGKANELLCSPNASSWIVYAPLPPLFLMLLTGLYMFVLPYVTWRGRLPADFNREDANSR
ncbi:MAG TPA: hypothetical protein VNB30_04850 [Rhizomicrobium sp.]|nr:hypothetical protein [Rhizomicrobium sp.]